MSTAPTPDHRDPFRAPTLAGALFLWTLLLFAGCKEKEATPEWTESAPAPEAPAEPVPPAPESIPEPPAEPVTEEVPEEAVEEQADNRLRFVSYNLKNFLTSSRYKDGERTEKFKPDDEIAALVKLVADANPDVLGLCEIGTEDDLIELQTRLKAAGLDLPHHQHGGGVDVVRNLGLLSRLPITANSSPKNLNYSLQGTDLGMSRGILDTTIETEGGIIRFLGVHLKSKREIPEADQELMRRNEAYLLRKHADHILESAPGTLLCVYGDFNETRRESPVRSIQGPSKSDRYLEPLSHKDSRGEVWTHYWDYQHVYSRFDYVLASRPLRSLFVQKLSRIIDDPEWSVASDHRPLLSVFKLEVKP